VRGPFAADADGTLLQSIVFPPGLPAGLEIFSQFWFPDAAGPAGWAATSGVRIAFP
jgi:hypothetical protein